MSDHLPMTVYNADLIYSHSGMVKYHFSKLISAPLKMHRNVRKNIWEPPKIYESRGGAKYIDGFFESIEWPMPQDDLMQPLRTYKQDRAFCEEILKMALRHKQVSGL